MIIKNILITGGTGFLGQRLARRLKQAGHRVTAVGRNEVAGKYLQDAGIDFARGDLADLARITGLCRGMDQIVHCGALSAPWGRVEDFYRANVLGTRNILQGARSHGIMRVVHVSTPSIYNEFRDRFGVTEQDPLPARMINAYAQTKLLAEQEVRAACQQGVAAIIIRPSGIFGPGDTSILPRLIAANSRRFIPVMGRGEVRVDITCVENVVDALELGLNAEIPALGQAYNITNGEPVVLHEFLRDLVTRLGYMYRPRRISLRAAWALAGVMETASKWLLSYKEPPLTRYAVGTLAFSRTLDISAARRDLGYVPRISVQDGVSELVRVWRTNG